MLPEVGQSRRRGEGREGAFSYLLARSLLSHDGRECFRSAVNLFACSKRGWVVMVDGGRGVRKSLRPPPGMCSVRRPRGLRGGRNLGRRCLFVADAARPGSTHRTTQRAAPSNQPFFPHTPPPFAPLARVNHFGPIKFVDRLASRAIVAILPFAGIRKQRERNATRKYREKGGGEGGSRRSRIT